MLQRDQTIVSGPLHPAAPVHPLENLFTHLHPDPSRGPSPKTSSGGTFRDVLSQETWTEDVSLWTVLRDHVWHD